MSEQPMIRDPRTRNCNSQSGQVKQPRRSQLNMRFLTVSSRLILRSPLSLYRTSTATAIGLVVDGARMPVYLIAQTGDLVGIRVLAVVSAFLGAAMLWRGLAAQRPI
jgi:hypothetical protein